VLLKVIGFVENRHNHLFFFALFAAHDEHLKISARGEHSFIDPTFVHFLLIDAVDLVFILTLNSIHEFVSFPFLIDFVEFFPLTWMNYKLRRCYSSSNYALEFISDSSSESSEAYSSM